MGATTSRSRDDLIAKIEDFVSQRGPHDNRKRPLVERQRLLGHCNWALNAYPLLRQGLSSSYAKIAGKTGLSWPVILSTQVIRALRWFAALLRATPGVRVLNADDWQPADAARRRRPHRAMRCLADRPRLPVPGQSPRIRGRATGPEHSIQRIPVHSRCPDPGHGHSSRATAASRSSRTLKSPWTSTGASKPNLPTTRRSSTPARQPSPSSSSSQFGTSPAFRIPSRTLSLAADSTRPASSSPACASPHPSRRPPRPRSLMPKSTAPRAHRETGTIERLRLGRHRARLRPRSRDSPELRLRSYLEFCRRQNLPV